MLQIKIEPLTKDAFAPFGAYSSMSEPDGYALCGELHRFYPDRLQAASTGALFGFSPITVKKPERMMIEQVEYHTTTWEIILPLNDDMILHVVPPSGATPVPTLTRAFRVPKNTLIRLNPAVWHLAPLPAKEAQLQAMIVLPACTYANDCTVCTLDKADRFELVW